MKIKETILRECLRVAKVKNTEALHPEWGNFHHFSFLIWEGKILSYATNKKGGCSHLMFGYSEMSKTHAEFELVRKNFWIDLTGSAVVNIRLNKESLTRVSFPCKACREFLKKNGIKDIVYSVNNDKFEELKLR